MGVSVGRRMVGLYMPSNVSNAWLVVETGAVCGRAKCHGCMRYGYGRD